MDKFDSLEKVYSLFQNVNCIGNDNCFFVVYKDTQKTSGFVGGMQHPYDALLINLTENGLGYYYLKQSGVPMMYHIDKMDVLLDSFTFIKNENIKSIIISKYALFNKGKKRITIKLNDGMTHYLFANVDEKLIPYHNDNFLKFTSKFEIK